MLGTWGDDSFILHSISAGVNTALTSPPGYLNGYAEPV